MDSAALAPALVHDSQRFDGMRIGFLRYVEALRSSGADPSVYTCVDPSSRERTEIDGTPLWGHRIPPGGAFEMAVNRLAGTFTRQIARIPQSPVHVQSVHLAPVARHRRDVVVGIPDLAKRTTRYYPKGASWVHNWLLRALPSAAAVVTSTEWGRQDIARVTGFPVDRIVAVPPFSQLPPPDPSGVRPPEPPTESRPWTLLYVAVDRPLKNVDLFLRLLAAVGPQYRGAFVGTLTGAHRQQAAQLGLGPRLTTFEGVPDLTSIYRSAQVFVFPSRYEGFGYPLMEAMSQGIPVVASRVTCIPEVVGPAAPLLDPDDLEAWRSAVIALSDPVAHVTAQRKSLAQSQQFNPARTAAGLRSAYALVPPDRRI